MISDTALREEIIRLRAEATQLKVQAERVELQANHLEAALKSRIGGPDDDSTILYRANSGSSLATCSLETACAVIALSRKNAEISARDLVRDLVFRGYETKNADKLSSRFKSTLVDNSNIWEFRKEKVSNIIMNVFRLKESAYQELLRGRSLDEVKRARN